MKKIFLLTITFALHIVLDAQTYCITFSNPVTAGSQFRISYTLVATVAVDATIRINDGNGNFIEFIPPAPGGLASYSGSFLSPTNNFTATDLGVLVATNGAIVTPSCNVLPIELVKFQAKPISEGNLLAWQSRNEINCSSFEIEKSTDGNFFKTIKEVKAKGNASDYEYLDSPPLSITSYYRLKINDFDGKMSYSSILSISPSQKGLTFKAYPNPFGDFLIIDISTTKKSDLTVELIDILGRSVFQSKTNAIKLSIPTDNLPNGAYFVKVSDGQTILQQKIIKD